VDAYRCDHNGHLDKRVNRGMAIEIGLTIFSNHVAGDYNPSEQRGSVELVRSCEECIGNFESTDLIPPRKPSVVQISEPRPGALCLDLPASSRRLPN
jgi:hypothetical protein